MKKNSTIVDTNVLIRFLTKDNASHFEKAYNLFTNAKPKSLEIPDVVICETVFVLLSVYEVSKDQVIERIQSLINFDKFTVNEGLLSKTLQYFSKYNISFVDAYLAARSQLKDKTLYTFDKNLLKVDVDSQVP